MEQDKIVSVFYTVVIPMRNPLIYSLKNKDVKGALKKIFQQQILWSHVTYHPIMWNKNVFMLIVLSNCLNCFSVLKYIV